MGATKQMFMQDRERQEISSPRKSLFNIRQDHLALLAQVEDQAGVLTPELEEALKLTEEGFKEKAISYGFVIKQLEATSEVISNEIKRLQALKQRSDNRAELFRTMLDEGMRQFGYEKVESELLRISYRKSSPVVLAENFADNILQYAKVSMTIVEGMEEQAAEAGITEDTLMLFDITPSVSKTRIVQALKEGTAVPGAGMPEKKNLQIK